MGFVKKSYGADVRFSVIYTYRNRNDDRCTLIYIENKPQGGYFNGKFIIKTHLQNLSKRL